MRTINFILLMLLILAIGIILGVLMFDYVINEVMEDYDLYNCIFNNANLNNFNRNPEMIKKIQDECICFREHKYTNLSEVNC